MLFRSQNIESANGAQSSSQSTSNSERIAGLKFNTFYKKHFTLGVGINYSIHHSEIYKAYESFLLDSNGVSIISNPTHVKTDFNVTDVPILVGYYFEANKFAFHFESGLSIALVSNTHSILEFDNSNETIDNFSGVSIGGARG